MVRLVVPLLDLCLLLFARLLLNGAGNHRDDDGQQCAEDNEHYAGAHNRPSP